MTSAIIIPQTTDLLGDALEVTKNQILDDIVNTQSDDINKINVTEEVAEYFARERPFSARLYSARSRADPWKCENQAVRQMYQASVKGPRRRYFPGYRGSALPVEPFSMFRPVTARQERLQKLKELKEKEMELLTEEQKEIPEENEEKKEPQTAKHFSRIETKLNKKATELMAKEPEAVEEMEEELTKMAEAMVAEVLTRSVHELKIQNFASLLVQQALEHAAIELGHVTPRQ